MAKRPVLTRVDPTEVHEIEGSFGQDDIRKVMMPLPFNPPSQVLFTLLGFLVDSAKGVVRTTFEELADSNANTPVGTTLARMEHGMVVFSSIHARVHDAMGRLLETLYRINKMYMDEQEIYDDMGELLAYRADFDGPVNVMPVSDPNIYSETQRFAQIQAVVARAQALPQIYDVRAVEEMLLKQLKIPEGESLLIPKPEVKEMNAVNENLAATMSRPLAAFPEQDHLAHLQVHLDFMRSPVLGSNRVAAPTALPMLLDHCREHMVLWYVTHMFNVTSEAAGVDVSLLLKDATKAERAEFDRMLAAASQSVINEANSTMEQIPQIIEEMVQFLQSVQPPPPPDPTAEVAQAEIQRKTQADAAKAQVDAAKIQTEQAKLQQRQQESAAELQQKLAALQMQIQEAQMREEREDARTQAEIAARMKMNADDNTTAKQLAALEIASGERIAVSTGTGINPTP